MYLADVTLPDLHPRGDLRVAISTHVVLHHKPAQAWILTTKPGHRFVDRLNLSGKIGRVVGWEIVALIGLATYQLCQNICRSLDQLVATRPSRPVRQVVMGIVRVNV